MATMTPEELRTAAKNLIDNPAFTMLMSVRAREITEDMLLTNDDKETLQYKAEYSALQFFLTWLEQHAGVGQHGRKY
jgi:hypothetical protein